MNNQFSGLSVGPAGVQGGYSPNLMQGNTNQFSPANIKGNSAINVSIVYFTFQIAIVLLSIHEKKLFGFRKIDFL